MTGVLPSLAEAKAQARDLRRALAAQGTDISHSAALERVARAHGSRDWNTFVAAIGGQIAPRWTIGSRVEGLYLNQPFHGTVLAVEDRGIGWVTLQVEFDEAVDVVVFDGFSNFRKRVRAEVGPKGHSEARLSDGTPHLQIRL